MRKTRAAKPAILTVRPKPGHKSRAILSIGPLSFPAAIGKGGRTAFKREGDGKTPIAAMPVLYGYVRADRMRALRTPLPMRPIRKGMLWCDAAGHAAYNRPVAAPFRPSHEELLRGDGLYDLCLVLDWNVSSRRQGRGSAIFFHLIRPGYEPTAGCVALSRRDMLRLLPLIRPGTVLRVL